MTAPHRVEQLPTGASGATAVDVARRCAAAAEVLIREHFGRTHIQFKGHRDVVTEADVAVERAVLAILAEEFPDHAILSEETASDGWSDGWMWVCDTIDGTRNFAQGLPHFAFSLALCHGGQPVLGLTTQPLLGWEFLAARGQGLTLNGKPAAVSQRTALRESVVALDLAFDSAVGASQLDLARALWTGVQGIRVSGSAALGFAYAAAGLWDAYVHRGLKPWDVAAGIILVEEGGGAVTAMGGQPIDIRAVEAAAGAPPVVRELLALAARSGLSA